MSEYYPKDKPECSKRKFRDKQKAINSSRVVANQGTHKMNEPEFCSVCDAWHMVGTKI